MLVGIVKYLKNPQKMGMCENLQKPAHYFVSVCYTVLFGNMDRIKNAIDLT
jgi:hypothetical protein